MCLVDDEKGIVRSANLLTKFSSGMVVDHWACEKIITADDSALIGFGLKYDDGYRRAGDVEMP